MNPIDTVLDYFPTALSGLALLAGCVVALTRWGKNPSVAMLALFGFGLLLVSSVGGLVLHRWIVAGGQGDFQGMRTRLQLLNVCRAVVTGGAYVCLIVAVFSGRAKPWSRHDDRPRRERDEDYDDGRSDSENVRAPRY